MYAPTFYLFLFICSSLWNVLPPSSHVAHSTTFFRTLLIYQLERISLALYLGHIHHHPVHPPSPITSTPGTSTPLPALLTLLPFCILICYVFTYLCWLLSVPPLPTLECEIHKGKDFACFVNCCICNIYTSTYLHSTYSINTGLVNQ